MLNRLPSEKSPQPLPLEWTESLSRLFNEHYEKKLKKEKTYFDVFGQIYPEELLVIFSYLPEDLQNGRTITLFLSCDPTQMKSEKLVKETQENYLEIAGLFFDEIFATKDWNEYEVNWQEVTHKNQTYYFKLTRENVGLSLEADKLLGSDFLDE